MFKFPRSSTDEQIQKMRTLRMLTNLSLVPVKEALIKTNWDVEEALKLLGEKVLTAEDVSVIIRR